MEELNMVNDMQEGVVDPSGSDPAASEAGSGRPWMPVDAEEAAIPQQETEEQEHLEKPVQSPEENAAFAAMRRQNEQLQRELNLRNLVFNALLADEEPEEAMDGLAPEMAENGMADGRSQMTGQSQMDAELSELREFRKRSAFDHDLNSIRRVHPEVTAQSIDELGQEYVRVMASGNLDPVTAYEIALVKQQREAIQAPPEFGQINTASTGNSDFYSLDELKSLSPMEVHKNWNKVERSRKKLFG